MHLVAKSVYILKWRYIYNTAHLNHFHITSNLLLWQITQKCLSYFWTWVLDINISSIHGSIRLPRLLLSNCRILSVFRCGQARLLQKFDANTAAGNEHFEIWGAECCNENLWKAWPDADNMAMLATLPVLGARASNAIKRLLKIYLVRGYLCPLS